MLSTLFSKASLKPGECRGLRNTHKLQTATKAPATTVTTEVQTGDGGQEAAAKQGRGDGGFY